MSSVGSSNSHDDLDDVDATNHHSPLSSVQDDGSDLTYHSVQQGAIDNNGSFTLINVSGSGTLLGGLGQTSGDTASAVWDITVDGGPTFSLSFVDWSNASEEFGTLPVIQFDSSLQVILRGTNTGAGAEASATAATRQ